MKDGVRLLLWVVGLAVAPAGPAQPSSPRIGYVYPAGGQRGTTFQVTIGGQFLNGATNGYISGQAVQAAPGEYARPLTPKELNDLREKIKELQKNSEDPQARKEIAEIRKRILKNPPNRQGNPAIAETVTLQVTVAADAEPGQREIRLGGASGWSNPLLFCIGPLPEFSKPVAKPNLERRPLANPGPGNQAGNSPVKSETRITLPAVINGQIMPGTVDRFRFAAHKGQRLVLAASARQLIPYLPDAVPGWFQAALGLYDAKGRELAYTDHFRFQPDPVLCCEIPGDGDYVFEIKDTLYRGRQDFVYRITAGELPYITGIFPMGGRVGAATTVELQGWNLPVATLTRENGNDGPGIHSLSVRREERISNRVPFALDTSPECLETEPNNQPASAQRVTLPVIVNGRIDQPGDADLFCFEGRAGQEIVAEVYARRLDSPLDSVIKLTEASGRQLAFNDDHEDKGAGLTTHHADSYLRATLPAGGLYYLHLSDAQGQGGPEYGYRLRLSPPQPDFELRVVPSGINVRRGGTVPITVYALRKDGFSNEIALVLKNAPAGLGLSGARVPAGQEQVNLTLTARLEAPEEPTQIGLEGRARIEGRQVVHLAVPAEDMMQAFAYRHLVPAQELRVAVFGRRMPRDAVRILSRAPLCIPAGGTARVRLGAPVRALFGNFDFELSQPPEGITLQELSLSGENPELVLHSDAAKVKPGLEGNLIFSLLASRTNAAGKGPAQGNRRPIRLGALPALPFKVVPP